MVPDLECSGNTNVNFLIELSKLQKDKLQNGAHNVQCCQQSRASNCGKLAFLAAASDIKVAQFLSSNYTPNFQ